MPKDKVSGFLVSYSHFVAHCPSFIAIWTNTGNTFCNVSPGCLVPRSPFLGRRSPHPPSLQLLASRPQTLPVKMRLTKNYRILKTFLEKVVKIPIANMNLCDRAMRVSNNKPTSSTLEPRPSTMYTPGLTSHLNESKMCKNSANLLAHLHRTSCVGPAAPHLGDHSTTECLGPNLPPTV